MKNHKKALNLSNDKIRTNEGGVAYRLTFKEKVAEFFSLGLLNGTFYQTEEEVLNDARDIFERALIECPEFATKSAIYGNNVNGLKLVPTIWLVYLSTLEDKTLFNKAFSKIIRNPKMLHDFMEIARKSKIRKGLGRSVKRAINNWLYSSLNEYQVSRNKGKLSEIIKVSRPTFKDDIFQNYMRYLAKDELTFNRVIALKEVIDSLNNGIYNDEVEEKILKNRLQLEELKHALSNLSDDQKKRLYYTMYKGLNYSALILNLVALERVYATETRQVRKYNNRFGFFNYTAVVETLIPDEIIEMVVEKIKDVDLYRRSNMLPFALLNAEKMVVTPEFRTAIGDMFKIVSKNAFDIRKDINLMVAVDTSGSMSGHYVTEHLTCADIASLMGSLIKKSHNNTNLYAVATEIKKVNVRAQDNLLDMAEKIIRTDVGHGTYFEQIMENYKGEKYVILLTDSESADNLERQWIEARKPKGAKLIVWQLSTQFKTISKDPSVIYLRGYSDKLLELVKIIIEKNGNQIAEIEKVQI